MAKRYPAHRVKTHRNYTAEEAAALLGAHLQTVRSWVRSGALPACTYQRPTLIVGADLRAFLNRRHVAAKCRLGPDEFFCLRCREPRQPAAMIAKYEPQSGRPGRLSAFCEVCDGRIYRMVRETGIDRAAPNLRIRRKLGRRA